MKCSAIATISMLLVTLAGCGQSPVDQQPEERLEPAPPPIAAAVAATNHNQPIRPQLLSDQELSEGWIALFDGESLFGWTPTSRADWHVKDGAIVVSQGEPGLLLTTTQFSDYILRADFKAPASTNSGIFLHTLRAVGPQEVAEHCYELNIAPPEHPFSTGSLVARKAAQVRPEADQWHSFTVTIQGGEVEVKLDDEQVLQYSDPEPLGRGYIGLQLNQGKVAFRNIKLKPLGLDEIFNGDDLSGWKTYPDMQSDFSVTDERYLHVHSGPGQLETEQQYADFVLQLECKTNAPNLNSGIFFRCIPGQKTNGYESQIHNGYEDGDPTQPTDYGTGGIFRRQKARRVVAKDLEWFTKTIVAHGPHLAVWVNGYQVSDWTDERPPHENPRQGLRVEAGTVQIQGHDPTTDILFRNLRAGEMPNRKAVETQKDEG